MRSFHPDPCAGPPGCTPPPLLLLSKWRRIRRNVRRRGLERSPRESPSQRQTAGELDVLRYAGMSSSGQNASGQEA